MSLRHKKQIIKDRSGDGGLTIHYMNREEFEACYQQSALDRTQRCAQETTIKEQKELIAALQKSLEDKAKELTIAQSSSREANDHRALLVAQHTQLEKDRDELKRDITALEDSHKSEVEALQQEAKANVDTVQKNATDELEESRVSYTQMKTKLEQQIHDLEQQSENLNGQVQTLQEETETASESIKSLQQSNETLEQSNKNLEQSHTTLGQYIQGQNNEIQAKTNALAQSKIEKVQLSREHKKLQETLESATDTINTRTSRITQLEKQYIERGEALIAATEKKQQHKEQQESSASKYNELETQYKLLENDNKVKNDEVQSLKKEVCEFKTRIDLKMKILLEKSRSTSQQHETQLSILNNSVARLEREKQAKDLVSVAF